MAFNSLSRDDTIEVPHGWDSSDRPPSIAVIEAVAAIRGLEPLDLDITLYDFVDPDALDRLFLEQKGGDLEVELHLDGFLVTIRSDGHLSIEEDAV